ncbi:MAG TPA: DUF4911 domain-containing protein [Thermotogales bacterium]|nr:DUF4911 domain-containing protein [Thermotogales bacterium]
MEEISRSDSDVLEYDVFVKVREEDVHVISYILEVEDNLLNIRKITDDGLLRIIVPKDLLEDVLELLNSLKDKLDLEIVRYERNPGKA